MKTVPNSNFVRSGLLAIEAVHSRSELECSLKGHFLMEFEMFMKIYVRYFQVIYCVRQVVCSVLVPTISSGPCSWAKTST